ncbi:unnamed protein product [Pylaiella littoralis]
MSRELSLEVPQSTGDIPAEEAKASSAPTTTAPGDDRKGGHEEEEEEEENASTILRRLSSPIFGTTRGAFNSDSDDNGRDDDGSGFNNGDSRGDGDGHGDGDEEEEEERREGAAEVVQRWWRECWRASKRVRVVVAAKPAFVRVQQLLDKLDAGQMSFERTGLALQNPDVQRAVAKALSVLPRDEALIAMPRASRPLLVSRRAACRSTRAVLSSLMIVYHPSEVLTTEDDGGGGDGAVEGAASSGRGRHKMDPVAAALRNASALLLASIKAVTASLGPVVAGAAGARKDAQRVAAQVIVQPYARAYAMRLAAVAQGDDRVSEMVQGQLDQYSAAVPAAAVGGGRGDGDFQLPDGRLGRLLGNERLAHEILVNPDFQIPSNDEDDPRNPATASSPEEDLARRFKDVMRRIFWDRFTQSLLPPPDPTATAATAADTPGAATAAAGAVAGGGGGDEAAVVEVPGLPSLRVGSKVHARYGSERGSYYAGTVLAVAAPANKKEAAAAGAAAGAATGAAAGAAEIGGESGQLGEGDEVLVDVRFDEDGMVERGVPVSRLKKRDDPPDFGPLLALLGEASQAIYRVREELVSLTPNNAALVGEVRAVLSQERLAEMLRDKTLDGRQVQSLLGFIAGRIHALQAPAREAGARAWLQARQKTWNGFNAQMETAAASGDALAVIPLLPRVFEFIFAQMEEIKRDSANAHIRLIAPYLARHGAAYERAKFEARLSSGAVSLERTKAWLSAAVEGFLGVDAGEGGTGDEAERSRRVKGIRDGREDFHKSVLRQAFVGLLRSPVRLDSPEAVSSVLPETLAGDGGRLAAARDVVDRVALVATLCVLVRQVLARLRIACPAPVMTALQAKTLSLLKHEGVNLSQIVEECVATAKDLATTSKEGVMPGGLPAAEEDGLRSLLASSADPKNEVFRVFFKRLLLALKGLVAGEAAVEACGRNGLQPFLEELAPAGARLQRLFAHHVKVHAGHYGPIVMKAGANQ